MEERPTGAWQACEIEYGKAPDDLLISLWVTFEDSLGVEIHEAAQFANDNDWDPVFVASISKAVNRGHVYFDADVEIRYGRRWRELRAVFPALWQAQKWCGSWAYCPEVGQ